MSDLGLGETNHAESGTELIVDPADGHVGNPYLLRVAPGLVEDPVTGVEAVGTTVGLVGRGSNTGVAGIGGSVGVTGRVGEDLKIPVAFDHAGVLGGSFGDDLAAGVIGETDQGIGVYGTSNEGAGVRGDSDEVGVYGAGLNRVGVVGLSTATGVQGQGGAVGVQGAGDSRGVVGASDQGIGVMGASLHGVGVYGQTGSPRNHVPGTFAGFFVGPVTVIGPLTVFGSFPKNAAVPHRDGAHRLLYSVESPESWFEDFGESELVEGKAEVQIDPEFAELVDTGAYHVFLTPYGDGNGLYVASRRPDRFEVREQRGGRSRIAFSYRIVARRRDIQGERLARISLPEGLRETGERPLAPPPEGDRRPRRR